MARPITCKICNSEFHIPDTAERADWEREACKCIVCGELYCNKPDTERKLFKLQDEYLKNKDQSIFEEMIVILNKYTESFIKKYYSTYIQEENLLKYYSHNAVVYFISIYLNNKDFRVIYSFGGQLINAVKYALFCKEEKMFHGVSLDYIFDTDGHTAQHADSRKTLIEEIERDENKKQIYNGLCDIIFNYEDYSISEYTNYKRLLALWNYMENGEHFSDKLYKERIIDEHEEIKSYETYGREGKLEFLETLDIMKKELKNWSNT